MISGICYNLLAIKPRAQIFVCAPSNEAANRAVEALSQVPELKKKVIRIYGQNNLCHSDTIGVATLTESNCPLQGLDLKGNLSNAKLKTAAKQALALYKSKQIVVTSCMGSQAKRMCMLQELAPKEFNLAIVDEAANAPELEVLVSGT